MQEVASIAVVYVAAVATTPHGIRTEPHGSPLLGSAKPVEHEWMRSGKPWHHTLMQAASSAWDTRVDDLDDCEVNVDGDRLGCQAPLPAKCGCGCFEQCYPKFKGNPREDVGVCGWSMPTLGFFAFLCFMVLLSVIVTVRMYLQWQDVGDEPVINVNALKAALGPPPVPVPDPADLKACETTVPSDNECVTDEPQPEPH